MGGQALQKYRVKEGRTIYRKVSLLSSIRKNCCTDLMLLKNLLGRNRNLTPQLSSEKFQSLGENRTNHPQSSSADALTTGGSMVSRVENQLLLHQVIQDLKRGLTGHFQEKKNAMKM